MTLISRVWSKAARVRAQRQGPFEDPEERRLEWVRTNAPGKSFADVGGMFKYVGDIAFLAEDSGAVEVTMVDIGDPDLPCEGNLEWGNFADKRRERGSKVRYVQGDLEEWETPDRVGVHDVVFYSGVLYHSPNPVLHLLQLRRMTRERLFLSTLTIPEIPGFPQACVFYPYMNAEDRRPFAAGYHWAPSLLGIGKDIDERPMYGIGNCFFGITPSALRAMLRFARFEVVEEHQLASSPFQSEWVCRPIPGDPLIPPVWYFRRRGEALEQGERWPYADWYEKNPPPN